MAFCPTVYYYKTTITCHYKKESLDSDGQQFHQYQLNKQMPLTSKHRSQKRDHDIC